MKGPTLSSRSDILTGEDTEPDTTPEVMIAECAEEILAAIRWEDYEPSAAPETTPLSPQKTLRNRLTDLRNTEIVALYLARCGYFECPWWADEALRKIFEDRLPVTKAAETVHAYAADLRLAGKGQKKRSFLRQKWEDHAFFQVATMRAASVSATEASEHAARWLDEFSAGDFTLSASTIEKEYPKWASDPLGGQVWCRQLSWETAGLTPSKKLDLIQCNKLRTEMLPPLPRGLKGTRR